MFLGFLWGFFWSWRAYLYQWRSRSQARCVTSRVAGCPVLTLLPPSHFAEPFVASAGVSCPPAHHPARQPLGRIRWEERRRVGGLPGVMEWVAKFETLGCKRAVEGQQPLWLPDGSSCWPAWPGDAALGTCGFRAQHLCLKWVYTLIFQHCFHWMVVDYEWGCVFTCRWGSLCWRKSRSWTSLLGGSAWLVDLLPGDSLASASGDIGSRCTPRCLSYLPLHWPSCWPSLCGSSGQPPSGRSPQTVRNHQGCPQFPTSSESHCPWRLKWQTTITNYN